MSKDSAPTRSTRTAKQASFLPVPSLEPLPTASTSQACENANAKLLSDLSNCTSDALKLTFDSKDEADEEAKTIVQCICKSSWRTDGPEIKYSLQSVCYPPGQLTKADLSLVYNGCGAAPILYDAVVNGVGIYLQLKNGEFYQPLAASSAQSVFGGILSILTALAYCILF